MRDNNILKAVLLLRKVGNRYTTKEEQVAEVQGWFDKECEAYTEKVLKKKYPECGVVFTRHAETIKAGYFTIWIDTGSGTVVTFYNLLITLKEIC